MQNEIRINLNERINLAETKFKHDLDELVKNYPIGSIHISASEHTRSKCIFILGHKQYIDPFGFVQTNAIILHENGQVKYLAKCLIEIFYPQLEMM